MGQKSKEVPAPDHKEIIEKALRAAKNGAMDSVTVSLGNGREAPDPGPFLLSLEASAKKIRQEMGDKWREHPDSAQIQRDTLTIAQWWHGRYAGGKD